MILNGYYINNGFYIHNIDIIVEAINFVCLGMKEVIVMTLFEKQFKKVEALCEENNITTYEQLVELLKLNMIPSLDDAQKDAVIILGYSGNGKSTYARRFCEVNEEYKAISWDGEIIKCLNGRRYSELPRDEHLSIVGQAIENHNHQNIILDGNYLNLPLRVALINTLHGYGYHVYLADLTPNIDKTLPFRIEDEIKRYQNMPEYSSYPYDVIRSYVTNVIYDFKRDEETRGAFSEQLRCGVVDLGVEKVLSYQDLDMKLVKEASFK